jgi:hypothetical protein
MDAGVCSRSAGYGHAFHHRDQAITGRAIT